MSKYFSDTCKEYLIESKDPLLLRWLKTFHNNFGDKEYLPMPTTCCWSLLKRSLQWMHLSHFLLLDANMAYDVSSDVLEKFEQCGATFFGSLFEHCTTAPLWIDASGTKCTINYPLDGFLTWHGEEEEVIVNRLRQGKQWREHVKEPMLRGRKE